MIYEYCGITFEWDKAKADKVKKDHRVTFEEACTVFFDDMFLSEQDYRDYQEVRYIGIGMSNEGRLLTVVYTESNSNTRLITSFKSTKEQIRRYQND